MTALRALWLACFVLTGTGLLAYRQETLGGYESTYTTWAIPVGVCCGVLALLIGWAS